MLAVTMMVDPSLVDNIHKIIQDTKADLPIPRPEATAILNISGKSLVPFLAIWIVISRKIFSCHLRGPLKSSRGVSFIPQGNTNFTKFNGSSLMFIDHSSVINFFSSSALYFIKKIQKKLKKIIATVPCTPPRAINEPGGSTAIVSTNFHYSKCLLSPKRAPGLGLSERAITSAESSARASRALARRVIKGEVKKPRVQALTTS